MDKIMRIIKNRVFIGIMCGIAAFLTLFLFMPRSVKQESEEHQIVRFKRQLSANTKIEKDMVELYTVSGNEISGIDDIDKVVGKYTKSVIYSGDFATNEKLANVVNDLNFSEISDGYVGVSISVETLAAGVSGKLNKGDVVKVYGFDDETKEVIDDPLLGAVEVLTITNRKAVDTDAESAAALSTGTEDVVPETITLKATMEQAKKLIEIENKGKVHVVFEARGEKAQQILQTNGGNR